jgi:ubiquinone/menaquinone biosynthesis C-methylase UbiE
MTWVRGAAGAAVVLSVAGIAIAVIRHARTRHTVPGGVLMGDAMSYDALTGALFGRFLRGVAADVAEAAPAGARVLDVGCGPGRLAIQLAREHGLAVVGIDLDPAMIERARAHARQFDDEQMRPTFVVGDAAAMPFPDGSFDVVVSTMSMHHWDDPAAGGREIDRVLRPDGRALIWELGPHTPLLHGHHGEPAELLEGTPLQLVRSSHWRWPWRFSFTRRLELEKPLGVAELAS